ncbi:MAG: TatD family hydrolase [Patescibacteria group bacterium]
MIQLIDTHAHLIFDEFNEDRGEVIQRAREAGLVGIVNVGCEADSSAKALRMADGKFFYATLGLHPYEAASIEDGLLGEWESLIKADSDHKIVAIGETGLDYFKSQVDHEKQKESFRKHVELAVGNELPVIVHNRQADEDCLAILREFPQVKAVFHCYGSTLEFARKVWDAGYITSFTGIITFPSASELREVVKNVPLDQFMVETDSPYLAPQAYRGKRNESAYVVEVAKKIAEIKNMSLEEVAELATENTKRFFRI